MIPNRPLQGSDIVECACVCAHLQQPCQHRVPVGHELVLVLGCSLLRQGRNHEAQSGEGPGKHTLLLTALHIFAEGDVQILPLGPPPSSALHPPGHKAKWDRSAEKCSSLVDVAPLLESLSCCSSLGRSLTSCQVYQTQPADLLPTCLQW